MGSLLRSLLTAVMTVSMLHVISSAVEPAENTSHSGWRQSIEEAEAAARDAGVPLLIHFQAWYCGPCRQMDAQVFEHADIQQALQQGIVSVQLDVTKATETAAKFNATTVPRDVVVYPNGITETLNVGFMPRSAYLRMLSQIARKGQELRVTAPATSLASSDEHSTGTSSATDNPDQRSATETPQVVGLEGYCPVRLMKNREWIRGKDSLTEEHRGIQYHFASETDRQEFRQNPIKFVPQNLGCDPVLLLSSQKAVSGSIEYGAFFDDHLYLFSSSENKLEFKKNPLRFTRIRHAVRIEDIQSGRIH
jgi:YHS domain-containing protein